MIESELHQPGRSAFTPSSINGCKKLAAFQHHLPATILHIHSFADFCYLASPICYDMSYSFAMRENPAFLRSVMKAVHPGEVPFREQMRLSLQPVLQIVSGQRTLVHITEVGPPGHLVG